MGLRYSVAGGLLKLDKASQGPFSKRLRKLRALIKCARAGARANRRQSDSLSVGIYRTYPLSQNDGYRLFREQFQQI
jgi:hypothetical protein